MCDILECAVITQQRTFYINTGPIYVTGRSWMTGLQRKEIRISCRQNIRGLEGCDVKNRTCSPKYVKNSSFLDLEEFGEYRIRRECPPCGHLPH